mgnify:CR=1 FL=1
MEYYSTGIYMSSAFDTIRRSSIIELLVKCVCYDDEIPLVKLLLFNTVLRVKGTLSAQFLSLLGVFQGDCLSGCLFTLVLAGALFELQTILAITMGRPDFTERLDLGFVF